MGFIDALNSLLKNNFCEVDEEYRFNCLCNTLEKCQLKFDWYSKGDTYVIELLD